MDGPSTWITTSTVLQRLANFGDGDAWSRFIERFRNPIVAYARRRGLSASDADDAAQEALTAFAQAFRSGAYVRERGRLSRWLFGFVHNKVLRVLEHDLRRPEAAEIERWSQVEGGPAVDPEWEEVWERSMLEQALAAARGEFQGSTWRVFEMLVLENRSVDDAVAETKLTRNAVYIAKHRVLARVEALIVECDDVG